MGQRAVGERNQALAIRPVKPHTLKANGTLNCICFSDKVQLQFNKSPNEKTQERDLVNDRATASTLKVNRRGTQL